MPILNRTEFVDRIESLPPLPAVAREIMAATESSRSSARDVAGVLRRDPVIAAKILRVANSPFFGAAGQITQLSRAATRLGTTAIRNLVLGICARTTLPVSEVHPIEHENLWHHAAAVAAACELIARRIGFCPAEEAFVTGLLHDTGHLVMLAMEPDTYCSILYAGGRGPSYLERERESFGIDHAEAGFRIMTRWGLPEPLCRAVHHHHAAESDIANTRDSLPALVVLGDILAHASGFGLDRPVGSPERLVFVSQQLQLPGTAQAEILATLERRVREAREMLGNTKGPQPPSQASHSSPGVAWICGSAADQLSIAQAVLEQRGYDAKCLPASDLPGDVTPDDLLLIDMGPGTEEYVREVSGKMLSNGYRRIAVLREPNESVPSRKHESDTGLLCIPRLFTALDIRWLEDQLRS